MSDGPTRTHPPADPGATASRPDPIDALATVTAGGGATAGSGALHATAPVGRYVFHGEIARGGMGVVYLATDTALNREVAVKALQDRYPVESPVARRFLDEARITAQLQHPAIPAVHDLGTLPDGRPFLAMKLIKGDTLADLLDARPDPAHDRGRFVADFEKVCQAVAFAHSKRVIHRDLKPANVMVGAFGEVQVMDWGLAKLIRPADGAKPSADPEDTVTAPPSSRSDIRVPESDQTQAGSVFGTPAYMPPEQAVGAVDQVDARSDVFGLGAILAVVLTGKPPYTGTGEVVRVLAARGKLDDCFARLDKCAADLALVALCKRCLSPEPADRPANADEVARAVAALRQAAEERTRAAELDVVRADGRHAAAELKMAEQRKRRRVQLALVAAVGLILLGGAAGGFWQDQQAAAQRTEAQARDRGERDRLARNAEAVAALLGHCEASVRADDVAEARVALDAAQQRADEGGADEHAARLARCRADVEVLAALDRFDTLWWSMTAGAYQTEPAKVQRREAFRAFGVVPDVTPLDEAVRRLNASAARERLLATLDGWLTSERSQGALAILCAADPDEYRNSVRAAVAADKSDRIKELAAQPDALAQPPRFAMMLGALVGGTSARGAKILVTALQRSPGSYPLLMSLGLAHQNKKETAAERAMWYQAAASVRPTSPAAWNNLGVALADMGEWERATASLQEAVRLDSKYARSRYNLALTLNGMGDRQGAIRESRESIRLDPKFAPASFNLGIALNETGDRPGAIAAYRDALALNPKFAAAHANLGLALKQEGDLPGAIAECREAVRLEPTKPLYRFGLGGALTAAGDLAGAEDEYREALSLDPDDVRYRHSLGGVLLDRDKVPEATVELAEASRRSPTGAAIWFDLGRAHLRAGDKRSAAAAWREAVRYDKLYVRAHTELAKALLDLGDIDDALLHANAALRAAPKDADAKMIQVTIRLKMTVRKDDRTAPPPREKK